MTSPRYPRVVTVAQALARACALHDRPNRPAFERARLRRELERWTAPDTAWGRAAAEVVRLALEEEAR